MARGRRGNGDGSAPIKRNDGRWQAAYTVESTGKRQYVYGRTAKEAQLKRDEAVHAQRQGRLISGPQQTVRQYFDQWLLRLDVRPTTLIDYQMCVKRVLPHIGRHQLRSLGPEHLEQAYTALKRAGLGGRPCAPNTIRHTHKVISTALNEAVERDLILRNPARKVGKNLVKGEYTEIQTLSREQVETLFESTEESRYHALWVFLIDTGCRRGEALTVRWNDIRWDVPCVTIKQTLEYVRGNEELGLTQGLRLDRPKTKNGIRTIPLNDDLCSVLRQHQTRQLFERKAAATWEDNDLVFCNEHGGYLVPETASQAFRRALKEAGIKQVRLHALRHTFATFLFEHNVHLKAVSSMLGHASIAMTADIYTHAINDVNVEAVATLNGLVRRKPA